LNESTARGGAGAVWKVIGGGGTALAGAAAWTMDGAGFGLGEGDGTGATPASTAGTGVSLYVPVDVGSEGDDVGSVLSLERLVVEDGLRELEIALARGVLGLVMEERPERREERGDREDERGESLECVPVHTAEPIRRSEVDLTSGGGIKRPDETRPPRLVPSLDDEDLVPGRSARLRACEDRDDRRAPERNGGPLRVDRDGSRLRSEHGGALLPRSDVARAERDPCPRHRAPTSTARIGRRGTGGMRGVSGSYMTRTPPA
jgi:hypothetical protein